MQPRREPPRRRGPALITALSDGGPQPRLRVHAVHPGALAATGWQGLAAALPADVAVQVVSLDAIEPYVTAADPVRRDRADDPDMRDLAAHVVSALPEPDGVPYVLVGWSFGGVVAAAAAHAAPRRPHLLVLLDSIAPVSHFTVNDDTLVDGDMLMRWFGMYLCAKRDTRLPPGTDLGGADDDERLRRLLSWCTANGVLSAGTPMSGFVKLFRSFLGGLSRNNRIVSGYRPAAIDVPTVLFKPVGSLLPEHGPLGWPELTRSGFSQLPCAGDHYTMLSEPSGWRLVADLIKQYQPSRTGDVPQRRPVPASIT
jgi:thioesterase domain-containing protein